MRFHQGVTFLPIHDVVDLAIASDDLGYAGFMISDHIFNAKELKSRYTYSTNDDGSPFWESDTEWPDPMCFISGLATVTRNLLFTTGVYIAPARDLVTVAKSVGAAAVLSNNRVRLGVGVGWCEEEFDATGQEFSTRGRRLDEMIVALRELWHEGWVEHHGTYYDIPACKMLPAPSAPVPILGGGGSVPALRRAVSLCDGWITHGAGPEEHAWEQLGLIKGALSDAGRSVDDFAIYLAVNAMPDVDLYKRFADEGVSDMLCAPWMSVQLPPDAPREKVVAARVEASQRFSDEIIAKVG
ncbi:MAG: TIGR03619 family F420-dependent LLM class oxidoreductase [Acidimicrobiales bacterium]